VDCVGDWRGEEKVSFGPSASAQRMLGGGAVGVPATTTAAGSRSTPGAVMRGGCERVG